MVFLTKSFECDKTRLNFACQFWNFPLELEIIQLFPIGHSYASEHFFGFVADCFVVCTV